MDIHIAIDRLHDAATMLYTEEKEDLQAALSDRTNRRLVEEIVDMLQQVLNN